MWRKLWATCLLAMAGMAVACGGDDGDDSPVPQLEGTRIATATPPTCDVASPIALPADFPADVAVPPNYLIESVQTSPHLRTVGRINPPPDASGVRSPIQELESAIADNMPGWTFGPNESDGGLDYTFTHTDGRTGNYTSGFVDGCPPYHLTLTYDIPWVTTP